MDHEAKDRLYQIWKKGKFQQKWYTNKITKKGKTTRKKRQADVKHNTLIGCVDNEVNMSLN